MNQLGIQSQLDAQRKTVSFDSYDITVRQLYDMTFEGIIDVAPEYQRHFVWNTERQSVLIESILLGIPVPSLFMATNKDSSWEVIDGLQRMTTIINFIGNDKLINKISSKGKKLRLAGLEKLTEMNGLTFEEIPKSIQLMFLTRPIRVTVLNDKTDTDVRFDLFERLNTGGVTLHPQEIRNCVYLGKFNNFIKELAENSHFRSVVKITDKSIMNVNYEELVLKYFAYYQNRNEFVHSVKEFLNDYMSSKTKKFIDEILLRKIFEDTFEFLAKNLPNGIVRGTRVNMTPLVLFEAISIGAADVLAEGKQIDISKLNAILNDSNLTKLTTGATNSHNKLIERINYVKGNISI